MIEILNLSSPKNNIHGNLFVFFLIDKAWLEIEPTVTKE